jgi:hypothetical protein
MKMMTLSHSQFHMPKKWLEHASREFTVNPSMTVVIGCHGVVSVSQAFARTRSRGEQVAEKSKAVKARWRLPQQTLQKYLTLQQIGAASEISSLQ